MKKLFFGFALILVFGLFYVSQASACKDCEAGESLSTEKTAYKEGVAQIKEI